MPTKTIEIFGNRKLDARPDRLDLRDRPYIPPVVTLPPNYPRNDDIKNWLPAYIKAGLVLDQKDEGSCTGFGLACVIHYLLWRQEMLLDELKVIEPVSTRMLYHLARFYDEWPGEDYEGSSCRGALKAWHHHGVCTDEKWPYLDKSGENAFVGPSPGWETDAMRRRLGVYYRIDRRSVVDIQAAICEVGAVYVSANVHKGWNVTGDDVTGHDSLPAIKSPEMLENLGGHAFVLVGYSPKGFVIQNSWGAKWGSQGFAVLPYDEWVRHGLDAWVCALGVPGNGTETSPTVIGMPRRVSLEGKSQNSAGSQEPSTNISKSLVPWKLEKAYEHTILMGNEGRPLNCKVSCENGAANVREVVAVNPKKWLQRQTDGTKRLVVYVHGGLNSEDGSLERIRVLAPYFEANGVYPLFITWKTGLLETLINILEDEIVRVFEPAGGVGDWFQRQMENTVEASDRTLEAVAGPIAKPVWTQMKQNARASADPEHGTELIARHLTKLKSEVEGLEIHLIGHSAGSILLGYFLDIARNRRLKVRSCSLYAPACTVAFANSHYTGAVEAGVMTKNDLYLHVLSDELERDDSVWLYRKSLLYLVSRALEKAHKTPLLGLQNVFRDVANTADFWNNADATRKALTTWQNWWQDLEDNLEVLRERNVSTGIRGQWCKATHGCFDNSAETITLTLTRILGKPPRYAIESLDY